MLQETQTRVAEEGKELHGACAALNRTGIRAIAVQSFLILLSFAILFAAAGALSWVNAWIYFGLATVSQAATWIVLARVNPEVINARGSVVKAGTKAFDKVWLALYPVVSLISLFIFGFDAVRFHWSSMPVWLSVLGIVIFVPFAIFAAWAMAANRFFEWTARIQQERSQHVVTGGPYRFVRHPGYISLIAGNIAGPLILGSWWGLVPSGILSLVAVARTALEDRTLQAELPGYREYAQKVKYRLVPGVW